MVLTSVNELGIMITLDNTAVNFFNLVYMRPWTRFATYGVGAIFGFMYFEYKNDQKRMQNSEEENFQPSLSSKIMISPKYSSKITYGMFISGLFLTTFFVFIQAGFYNAKLNVNPWSNIS